MYIHNDENVGNCIYVCLTYIGDFKVLTVVTMFRLLRVIEAFPRHYHFSFHWWKISSENRISFIDTSKTGRPR